MWVDFQVERLLLVKQQRLLLLHVVVVAVEIAVGFLDLSRTLQLMKPLQVMLLVLGEEKTD